MKLYSNFYLLYGKINFKWLLASASHLPASAEKCVPFFPKRTKAGREIHNQKLDFNLAVQHQQKCVRFFYSPYILLYHSFFFEIFNTQMYIHLYISIFKIPLPFVYIFLIEFLFLCWAFLVWHLFLYMSMKMNWNFQSYFFYVQFCYFWSA